MTPGEHDTGVMLDEGEGVTVQVTKHGVALPAAEDADLVGINAAEEEGHGSAGAERPCCDVVRVDAGVARDSEGGSAE